MRALRTVDGEEVSWLDFLDAFDVERPLHVFPDRRSVQEAIHRVLRRFLWGVGCYVKAAHQDFAEGDCIGRHCAIGPVAWGCGEALNYYQASGQRRRCQGQKRRNAGTGLAGGDRSSTNSFVTDRLGILASTHLDTLIGGWGRDR